MVKKDIIARQFLPPHSLNTHAVRLDLNDEFLRIQENLDILQINQ